MPYISPEFRQQLRNYPERIVFILSILLILVIGGCTPEDDDASDESQLDFSIGEAVNQFDSLEIMKLYTQHTYPLAPGETVVIDLYSSQAEMEKIVTLSFSGDSLNISVTDYQTGNITNEHLRISSDKNIHNIEVAGEKFGARRGNYGVLNVHLDSGRSHQHVQGSVMYE